MMPMGRSLREGRGALLRYQVGATILPGPRRDNGFDDCGGGWGLATGGEYVCFSADREYVIGATLRLVRGQIGNRADPPAHPVVTRGRMAGSAFGGADDAPGGARGAETGVTKGAMDG